MLSSCSRAVALTLAFVVAVRGPKSLGAQTPLTNGVAKTGLSGAVNSATVFTIVVPGGQTLLEIKTSGGTGDADLFARIGSAPTRTSTTWQSRASGTNVESIPINSPAAGTYYIMLDGWAAYTGVTLVATYSSAPSASPSASITSTAVSATAVTTGQSVDLTIVGSNAGSGGANTWGYMSVAVRELNQVGDAGQVVLKTATSAGSYDEYERGKPINVQTGGTIPAQYLLTEYSRQGWAAGVSNTFEVTWTPTRTGAYTIEYKLALQTDGADGYSRQPTSGSLDQQGANVVTRTVTVTAPSGGLVVRLMDNGVTYVPNAGSSFELWLYDASNTKVDTKTSAQASDFGVRPYGNYRVDVYQGAIVIAQQSITHQSTSTAASPELITVAARQSLTVTAQNANGSAGPANWRVEVWDQTPAKLISAATSPAGQATFNLFPTDKSSGKTYTLRVWNAATGGTEISAVPASSAAVAPIGPNWAAAVTTAIALSPVATISTALAASATTVTVGQSVDFSITGKNTGSGSSNTGGYLSIAFRQLTGASDGSQVQFVNVPTNGGLSPYTRVAGFSPIYNTDNSTRAAAYLLAEWERDKWPVDEMNTFTARWTPTIPGTYTIEAKFALAAGSVTSRAPSSGSVDQQGAYVQTVTVTVVAPRLSILDIREFDVLGRAVRVDLSATYTEVPLIKAGAVYTAGDWKLRTQLHNPATETKSFQVAVDFLDRSSGRSYAASASATLAGGETTTKDVTIIGPRSVSNLPFDAALIPSNTVGFFVTTVKLIDVQSGSTLEAASFALLLSASCDGFMPYSLDRQRYAVGSQKGAVVLVHGFDKLSSLTSCGGSKKNYASEYFDLGTPNSLWDKAAMELTKNGYDVWMYRWPTDLSIEVAGENLASMIRTRGEIRDQPLAFVGHSMGGLVALTAATRVDQVQTVRRVVTLASPHLGTRMGLLAPVGVSGWEVANTDVNGLPAMLVQRVKQHTTLLSNLRIAGGVGDEARSFADDAWDGTVTGRSAYAVGAYPLSTWMRDPTGEVASSDWRQAAWVPANHSDMSLTSSSTFSHSLTKARLQGSVLAALDMPAIAPVATVTQTLAASAATITVGQSVDLTITGNNTGTGPSNAGGYLSIAFPQLTGTGDGNQVSFVNVPINGGLSPYKRAAGFSPIYNTDTSSRTAAYLLTEWERDNWPVTEENTFTTRWTPTTPGTYTIEGKFALADGATASRAPSSGSVDQQGAFVQTITVTVLAAPVATILSFDRSSPTVQVGLPVDIFLLGRNAGTGPANTTGFLSIGFPGLTRAGDDLSIALAIANDDGVFTPWPAGSSLSKSGGGQVASTYPLEEYSLVGWPAGQQRLLKMRWTPTRTGTFVVEGRMALQTSPSTQATDPLPGAGDGVDQQQYAVRRITISVTPAATQLAVMTQPGGAASGTAFTVQPLVEIRDAGGARVTASTAEITASVLSGSGTLAGAATVTAVAGVATFTNLKISGGGPHTLQFTAAGIGPVTSTSFTVAQTATQVVITTQPAGANSGTPFTTQPVLEIREAGGAKVAGSTATVTAILTGGSGTLIGGVATATGGVATFTNMQINGAGPYTIQFTATGLTAATADTLTVTQAATQIAVTTQPGGANSGAAFTIQPIVEMRDVSGTKVATSAAAVTVAVLTGSGTLVGTTTVNAVAGVATFTNLQIIGIGSFTLSFGSPGLTSATATFYVFPSKVSGTITVAVGNSSPGSVTPSGKFVVPILLDMSAVTGANVRIISARMTWGADRLAFDSLRAGTFGGLVPGGLDSASLGIGRIVWYAAGTTASIILANVHFTASPASGSTQVAIGVNRAETDLEQSVMSLITVRNLDVCVGKPRRLGDVNDDGSVNIIDAQQIARYSVGLSVGQSVGSAGTLAENGDVTGNGAVNIIDAQQIARFSVGLSAAESINTILPPKCSAAMPVATVDVSPPTVSLTVGQQLALTATTKDSTGAPTRGRTAFWTSSNDAIATVSSAGFVTALAGGTATITATSEGKTGTATVTVVSAGSDLDYTAYGAPRTPRAGISRSFATGFP